jgi:shikimate dehydrogenase
MTERRYRFGLIGRDVNYSLSPRIFEWALDECGLQGDYEILNLESAAVPLFLRTEAARFDGLNVTIPHKGVVAANCDRLEIDAAAARAANAIRFERGELVGGNTDVAGFRGALELLLGCVNDPKRSLVLGAGGAARAVLVALAKRGFGDVTIAVRDVTRATLELESIERAGFQIVTLTDMGSMLEPFDLIVQATPVGSVKCPGSPIPRDARLSDHAVVMDLIYAPRETELLRLANAQGVRTMNGLPMLIGQALAAFEWWTGNRISIAVAMRELLPQLQSE